MNFPITWDTSVKNRVNVFTKILKLWKLAIRDGGTLICWQIIAGCSKEKHLDKTRSVKEILCIGLLKRKELDTARKKRTIKIICLLSAALPNSPFKGYMMYKTRSCNLLAVYIG